MKNGNQPINPHLVHTNSGEVQEYSKGLTKREYFAIQALQGILSSRELQKACNEDRTPWHSFAVEIADELLKELEK